jgi:large repetitive protein
MRRGGHVALLVVAALVAAAILVAPVSADVPPLNLPNDITAEATSSAGASVSFTVTSPDGTAVVSCDHNPGSTFPIATTTVNCTADSPVNGIGSGSFQVTVHDTTPPHVSVPNDRTETTQTHGGLVENYNASASDAVDGSITPSCSPASGSTFPEGQTTVTCTAQDSHGNTGSASFHITVNFSDTMPPVVSVPGDIHDSTTSPSGKSESYSASANDNVDGALTPSCSPSSGSTFPIGSTTVTCTATDSSHNTGSASFHVVITLVDNTPPVVNVPNDINQNTTSPTGKTVNFNATANDNIDGPITPSCSPSSGSNFPVGQTTVTCSATDSHGNTGSASFHVTITLTDNTPPVVNVPDDIHDTTTAPTGKAESFSVTATDNVDGPITPSCSPVSGSNFPVGSTTVTCTAKDAHNNTGSASFHVVITLTDNTPPVVTVPADITTPTTNQNGKVVTFTATATDNIDGAIAPACDPASGTRFPVGTTTVTCTATDAHHNTGTASFHITVTLTDNTPPVVSAPADITKEATSGAGAVATFTATANDNIDGPLTPTCSPPSGSTFPIAVTTVTCSATDAHGNTGMDTFKVTVQDTTKPTVTVPSDITVDATGPGGAAVTFSASGHDTVDGTIGAPCDPGSGSTFPVGTTTVTCTATDAHHNASSASFHVTVVDRVGPVVTVPPTTTVEATSGAGAVVTFTVSATDAIDGPIPPPIPCSPLDTGATFPLGTTHVTCTAHDASGNGGSASFNVVVRDTTPPRLNVPNKVTLSSSDGGPLAASQPSIAAFLASPQATDLVDGKDAVTNNAPASFPVGTTTITFTAKDKAGNTAIASSSITIVYNPGAAPLPPPPPPDTTPPPDPTKVNATAGDRKVTITWTAPSATDLDHYVVEESLAAAPPVPVYTGTATKYTATSLTNGAQYRFVVVSVDKAGNQSTGAVVTATPKAAMLVKPADGATITSVPTLVWVGVGSATYYNVQVYRVPALSAVGGKKILSAWPTSVSLPLTRTWKYDGVAQQLAPGIYRWYVWPGLGPRADGKYGPLLGSATFVVKSLTAAAKPPAQKKPKAKAKPKTKTKPKAKPKKTVHK